MAKIEKKEKKEKKESNPNIIIVILLVVIIVGLLALAGGFYFFSMKGSGAAKVSSNASSSANTNTNKNVATNDSKVVSALAFPLTEEFLLNLSDEGGKNFVKAKISVGYDNKKLTPELTIKVNAIRDAINSVLRSKKSTDFSSEKNVDDIKREILARVNLTLSAGQANNIYFDDILIQ